MIFVYFASIFASMAGASIFWVVIPNGLGFDVMNEKEKKSSRLVETIRLIIFGFIFIPLGCISGFLVGAEVFTFLTS